MYDGMGFSFVKGHSSSHHLNSMDSTIREARICPHKEIYRQKTNYKDNLRLFFLDVYCWIEVSVCFEGAKIQGKCICMVLRACELQISARKLTTLCDKLLVNYCILPSNALSMLLFDQVNRRYPTLDRYLNDEKLHA